MGYRMRPQESSDVEMVAGNPPTRREAFRPVVRYTVAPQRINGRPLRFTRELALAIADTIARGTKPVRAAAMCGIPRSTFNEWRRRALNGDKRIKPLFAVIEAADDVFVGTMEESVAHQGKDGDPRVLLALLAARRPREYGRLAEKPKPKAVEEQTEPEKALTEEELATALSERGLPTDIFGLRVSEASEAELREAIEKLRVARGVVGE